MSTESTTKVCKVCGQTKLTAEFYRHRLTKDGLWPYCKECCSARNKANRAANLDRERARRKGVTVCDLTLDEWNAIVAAYEGKCAYCGCVPEKLQMEHVIPFSAGGQHTAANVAPACQDCNYRKHTGPAPAFNRIPIESILTDFQGAQS